MVRRYAPTSAFDVNKNHFLASAGWEVGVYRATLNLGDGVRCRLRADNFYRVEHAGLHLYQGTETTLMRAAGQAEYLGLHVLHSLTSYLHAYRIRGRGMWTITPEGRLKIRMDPKGSEAQAGLIRIIWNPRFPEGHGPHEQPGYRFNRPRRRVVDPVTGKVTTVFADMPLSSPMPTPTTTTIVNGETE